MGPDMDHMRLSQHYSTPTRGTGTTNLDSLDGWHSYPSPTPGYSPVIRGLSVDELKQQTAQRITQTVFNQQSPRLDQRQQQQDYMVANEKGAGRQLRGQYSYPGTTNSPRISTSDASRRFQSAPGSLSTDPRRFQSAPGSIPDSSAQQHVQQRVGIPHGLTVHELKAMTRARLALCAVSSGPSQVKAHEKAATSSVSHSPASMLSKETTPCSGSSHSYAPMPKQQQMHHFVKNFQVLEQQKQIREEACRLENRRVSENESAAHYLCTTSSNQSANGSSPASMKDRNIRMKPFPNQPHRMHQQVTSNYVLIAYMRLYSKHPYLFARWLLSAQVHHMGVRQILLLHPEYLICLITRMRECLCLLSWIRPPTVYTMHSQWKICLRVRHVYHQLLVVITLYLIIIGGKIRSIIRPLPHHLASYLLLMQLPRLGAHLQGIVLTRVTNPYQVSLKTC